MASAAVWSNQLVLVGISPALRVYQPSDWEAAGVNGVKHMEQELKSALEGMAKHLFGDVEVRVIKGQGSGPACLALSILHSPSAH